eukprot:m.120716 g.120716  ORF g.120716 m.120716 type:complete len:584 (+) comp28827_c2_seq1:184-1935(+)
MAKRLEERLSISKSGYMKIGVENWRRVRSLVPGEVSLNKRMVTVSKIGTKKPVNEGSIVAADSFSDEEEIEFGICLVLRWEDEQHTSILSLASASEQQEWLMGFNASIYAQDLSNQYVDSSPLILKNLLGVGAFGKVYKASMHGLDVAVKFFQNEEVREEFCQEAGVLLRAQEHPNVLKFIGVSIFDDFDQYERITELPPLGLVTELCANGNLRKFLVGDVKLDFEGCRKMALGIAEGCCYIHSQGIVHRDLKPDNIMLDGNHMPKLVDFGQSRVVALDRTMTADVRGSLLWRAPEIMTGGNGKKTSKITNYGIESDIYSFGIIFWQIVSRDEPYKSVERSWDIIRGVQDGTLRPHCEDHWPPRMAMLMRWCWAGDPCSRPTASEAAVWLNDATIIDESIVEEADEDTLPITKSPSETTLSTKAPTSRRLAAIEARAKEKTGMALCNDLAALVVRLRQHVSCGGLPLRDRRFLGLTISSCFIGKDLITLVQDWCSCSLAEANAIGCKLQTSDFISHTIQGTKFSQGCFFYWRKDPIVDRLLLLLEDEDDRLHRMSSMTRLASLSVSEKDQEPAEQSSTPTSDN